MHEVVQLADGWPGTNTTVAIIARLVGEAQEDPVVRQTAENIVRGVDEYNKPAEIRAISNFVRRHVRYTNEGIETTKTPRVLVDEIAKYGRAIGDCDDMVTLWLALQRMVGTKCRLRVISQRQDGLANHIFGQAWDGRRWISDDTIRKDKPIGWRVPGRLTTREEVYPQPDTGRRAGSGLVPTYCGGSDCRTLTSPDGAGVGWVAEVVIGVVGAGVSVYTTTQQMKAAKASMKQNEEAMREAKRQFDEQMAAQREAQDAASAAAAGGAKSLGLPSWAGPATIIGAGLLLAWYLNAR